MIFFLVSLSIISKAEATPKERLKVKYKVKTGGKGEEVERRKVVEDVMDNNIADPPIINSYKEVVTTMMGQLERAARSQDL